MTRQQKLQERFLENPSSCTLVQIEKLLELHGCIRVQAKGSHVKWKHITLTNDLIIPVHNNDCKDFYKHAARKFIMKIYNI